MSMMYPLPWLYPRLPRCANSRLVKPPNMPLSRGVDTDGVTEGWIQMVLQRDGYRWCYRGMDSDGVTEGWIQMILQRDGYR